MQAQGGSLRPLAVLLADDHALFRAGMRYLLGDLPYSLDMDQAESYPEVVRLLEQRRYDLILLDLIMPGVDRSAPLRDVRTKAGETPIIIVSMLDSPSEIRLALEGGAAGFIPKNSRAEVMVQAINLVLSGGIYLPPALLKTYQMQGGTSPPPQGDERRPGHASGIHLTERQQAVLQELAKGKSNKQIAYALDMSEATVKVHITAIMKVLNVRNRTQAILVATERGLLG